MSKANASIIFLIFALVVPNGCWGFNSRDSGVTAAYRKVTLQQHHQALVLAIAILPVAANPSATRQDVLAAAHEAVGESDSFEKNGLV